MTEHKSCAQAHLSNQERTCYLLKCAFATLLLQSCCTVQDLAASMLCGAGALHHSLPEGRTRKCPRAELGQPWPFPDVPWD